MPAFPDRHNSQTLQIKHIARAFYWPGVLSSHRSKVELEKSSAEGGFRIYGEFFQRPTFTADGRVLRARVKQ